MSNDNLNPGLERMCYALRANGIPPEQTNPLRNGVHTRGYLPHVKREGASYFVTFRLADSLPKEILIQLKSQLAKQLQVLPNGSQSAHKTANLDHQRQIERYLDRGIGACHLKRPEIAQIVVEALLHFHKQQYQLDEWVIMPNHLHLILWPLPNHTLSDILRSRKRHTARQINLVLGRTGQSFWQRESYDHWIRNEDEKARIRRYIRNNPVTAGLCSAPEEWPWGSAAFEHHKRFKTGAKLSAGPQLKYPNK